MKKSKAQKNKFYTVIIQKWEESERGWGTRPDGYSMHLTEAHHKNYCKRYWDGMPKGEAPDEYSRECGHAYEAKVDQKRYNELKKAHGNLRFYDNQYPGSGGTNGWRPIL